jgi:hypothetical protein
MTKYLLVTSDDFGMCHAVNAGIVQAMTGGIVRSTNFLVPCPWFSEALALAKELELAVGVHLCVTCDWDRMKWGPLTRAASLVDEHGHFWPSFEALAAGVLDEDLYRELDAQIERVKSLGVEPTHVDSHMLVSGDNGAFTSRVKAVIRRLCDKHRLLYTYEYDEGRGPAHFQAELCCSPLAEDDVWSELMSWTAPGVYHLIGHAALASAELSALCSSEHPSRRWAAEYRLKDFEFFTDPATRERIEQLGFELIDVRRLRELRAAQ